MTFRDSGVSNRTLVNRFFARSRDDPFMIDVVGVDDPDVFPEIKDISGPFLGSNFTYGLALYLCCVFICISPSCQCSVEIPIIRDTMLYG